MGDTLVRMPKLADTLVEGTLGQWLKQVGDEVRQGEPLASVETDKVTTEISSPGAGTLLEILVAEGQTVAIETPIARIGAPAPPTPSGPTATTTPVPTADTPPVTAPSPAAGDSATTASSPAPKPTPVAARLLAEHGLDPRLVAPRAGRLTKRDVLQHLQSSPPTTALIPLTPMRRAIADHMTRAYETIPTGQTVMAADLTRLVDWRERHKHAFQQAEGANLTFTVLFVHALAKALAHNATEPVNIGVAVAIDGGLIVPVLRGVDKLSLKDTAQQIAGLAMRARASTLSPGETHGAQMTLTNVGSFGNLSASPIVPLTQMGILAPGLVEQRPMPGPDSGVRLGWRCLLSLMFDRRAIDDFAADRLLRGVLDELERIPQSV
jgi:2-oxoglutarate dehydrogenase E2 component (dihydrolipoamide succinyltransferase)